MHALRRGEYSPRCSARSACRIARRAIDFVLLDPSPKVVGTTNVYTVRQPRVPAHPSTRYLQLLLSECLTGSRGALAGIREMRDDETTRRRSCVILASSGSRNVAPCRCAAVLQGQKDASRLSSVLHARSEGEAPRAGHGLAD